MRYMERKGARRWRRLLLVAATALCAAQAAHGQPIFGAADSLELMAADSVCIVRGALTVVKTEDQMDQDKPDWGHWRTVSMRVVETIKGPKRTSVDFVLQSLDNGRNAPKDDAFLREVQQPGKEVIAFLQDTRCLLAKGYRRYARFDLAPRTGVWDGSFVRLSPGAGTQAFSMEPAPLIAPEALLAVARAAARFAEPPGALCSHRFMLRADIARDSAWAGYAGIQLSVPVDSRLEARAHAWLAADDPDARVRGAEALVYFRSDANAKLLLALMSDPGTRVYQRATYTTDVTTGKLVAHGLKERVYLVREAAAAVLAAWGREVPAATLREPLPSDDRPLQ